MKRFQFSVLLLLVLLVASCTSRKKLVKPDDHSNFQWMSAKIQVEIVSGDTTLTSQPSPLNLSGTIRMRRDSTVWISLSALLGMESVRAMVTQDSVFVINRMGQNYLAEPNTKVGKRFRVPTSLTEVQSLLLGNGSGDHVKIQHGPYQAIIRYSDIHWDEPTTFPLKINKNYQRMKL